MSNANTSTQQQSANGDKSVHTEQGQSKVGSEENNYGTGMTYNSAMAENACEGCHTGKCDNTTRKKTESSK